jgi:hypothetical protein
LIPVDRSSSAPDVPADGRKGRPRSPTATARTSCLRRPAAGLRPRSAAIAFSTLPPAPPAWRRRPRRAWPSRGSACLRWPPSRPAAGDHDALTAGRSRRRTHSTTSARTSTRRRKRLCSSVGSGGRGRTPAEPADGISSASFLSAVVGSSEIQDSHSLVVTGGCHDEAPTNLCRRYPMYESGVAG